MDMRPVLRSIYAGERPLAESLRPTAESIQAWEAVDRQEAALKEILPPEKQELLLRYQSAYSEVIDQYGALCFEKGFSMGAKLILELLDGEE